ncbi:3-ketoacyl-CoA thiolase [Fructilactobacillus lindneri]|uniref:acetyl-CoA C-acetyltransferase n=2 Tax=Fructilactobacillus lindneri TaxID=53444 RepID=A0A0R2JX57_9LACO|nr:thiolase family protein [Fructilactobacillus lindneri]ANZ57621.1 3-ketoacyl-CoA thiolase [Fructilactobacillus lindneri]ANZ58891.1 3-ketoacyl-CoA thiolase [Fructilactobacillus lindneri]KRN79548.1 acetyl-CoA acetyltransferase [Fructilactobacillus lindneri DSM 20690 = JCM 11027]POG97772.1 3-ketoacyl-CoA thiolase [Fructilactobacillus lindneri]POH00002.1 3-ketoacyl-CoA thiolase [Fructilactobacillus lindneri]
MEKIAIISAKRTPIGKINGNLKGLSSVELGTIAVKATLAAANLDPSAIDQVIFGNVIQAGGGQNIARQIELNAGIPATSTACTINQVCGSGMKAVRMGQTAILNGDAEVVIVGGTESMSNAPYLNPKTRAGHKFGAFTMEDSIETDGLNDAKTNEPMGITAENVAEKFNISRADQDNFSLASHQKAAEAIKNDYLNDEMIPITINGKKETITYTQDETVRPDTNLEQLSKLNPAFKKAGTVTAGNAASLNDGASALILMKESKAEKLGIKPLAIIDEYAEAGCDPKIMGYAPYYAVNKLLQKQNKTISDFDLFELNEAFASQSIAVSRDLNIPDDKLNITGGAIAMGHPLGDSGSRILITLINNLRRTKQKSGLATLCIGGGMAMAMSIHLK